MSHFAKVENGVVTSVIVAEQDFIDTYNDGIPGEWVQTSYNTVGGVHILGGTPLRKNFAGIGMTYDKDRDAFIPVKPYASWVLNEDSCLWKAPVSMPEDGSEYVWDEAGINWKKIDTHIGGA